MVHEWNSDKWKWNFFEFPRKVKFRRNITSWQWLENNSQPSDINLWQLYTVQYYVLLRHSVSVRKLVQLPTMVLRLFFWYSSYPKLSSPKSLFSDQSVLYSNHPTNFWCSSCYSKVQIFINETMKLLPVLSQNFPNHQICFQILMECIWTDYAWLWFQEIYLLEVCLVRTFYSSKKDGYVCQTLF